MTYSTYHLIAEVLTEWQNETRPLGTAELLRVHELLAKIPADTEGGHLKALLAPLLVRNKMEQAQFYEVFEKIEKQLNQTNTETETQTNSNQLKPTQTNSTLNTQQTYTAIFKKLWQKSRVAITAISVVFALVIACFVFWDRIFPKIPEIRHATQAGNNPNADRKETAPTPDDTPIPQDTLPYRAYDTTYSLAKLEVHERPTFTISRGYFNSWNKVLGLIGTIGGLILVGNYFRRRRRELTANAKSNQSAPYKWNIKLSGVDRMAMDDNYHRAAAAFRHREASQNLRFDVPRTVKATILRGGLATVAFRPQSKATAYLFLIEMPSTNDHRAQFWDFVSKRLIINEVEIERYFYNGDPRLCWNERNRRGVSLKDLQHQFSEHRLVVIGSGDGFISPVSGRFAKWAEVLDGWRQKLLFSTRNPTDWAGDERELFKKFRIVPATPIGFANLVDTIEAIEPPDYRNWQMTGNRRQATVGSQQMGMAYKSAANLQIPEGLTDDEIITMLRPFFMRYAHKKADDRILQWLGACALAPMLHWDLTLYFGHELTAITKGEPLVTLQNVAQLSQTNWFVTGKMPDHVRRALVGFIEKNHPSVLERLRVSWANVLSQNPPPSDSMAFEEQRLALVINELEQKPNLKKRFKLEREMQQLLAAQVQQDVLVIEYLNRRRSFLETLVPKPLRKFAIDESNYLPTFRNWLWQMPLVLIAAFSIYCFNPHDAGCGGVVVNFGGKKYCLSSEQDILTILDSRNQESTGLGKPSLETDIVVDSVAKSNTYFEELLKKAYNSSSSMEEPSQVEGVFSELITILPNADKRAFVQNASLTFFNMATRFYNAGDKGLACQILSDAKRDISNFSFHLDEEGALGDKETTPTNILIRYCSETNSQKEPPSLAFDSGSDKKDVLPLSQNQTEKESKAVNNRINPRQEPKKTPTKTTVPRNTPTVADTTRPRTGFPFLRTDSTIIRPTNTGGLDTSYLPKTQTTAPKIEEPKKEEPKKEATAVVKAAFYDNTPVYGQSGGKIALTFSVSNIGDKLLDQFSVEVFLGEGNSLQQIFTQDFGTKLGKNDTDRRTINVELPKGLKNGQELPISLNVFLPNRSSQNAVNKTLIVGRAQSKK